MAGYLPPSILLTCPYHFSCCLSTKSSIGSTSNSSLISELLLLSHLLTPTINLRTFISAASTLLLVRVVNVHASEPYMSIGRSFVVYTSTFTFLGTCLFLKSGYNCLTPLE